MKYIKDYDVEVYNAILEEEKKAGRRNRINSI